MTPLEGGTDNQSSELGQISQEVLAAQLGQSCLDINLGRLPTGFLVQAPHRKMWLQFGDCATLVSLLLDLPMGPTALEGGVDQVLCYASVRIKMPNPTINL